MGHTQRGSWCRHTPGGHRQRDMIGFSHHSLGSDGIHVRNMGRFEGGFPWRIGWGSSAQPSGITSTSFMGSLSWNHVEMQKIATSRCCDWSNSARELRSLFAAALLVAIIWCSVAEERKCMRLRPLVSSSIGVRRFALENAAGGGSL